MVFLKKILDIDTFVTIGEIICRCIIFPLIYFLFYFRNTGEKKTKKKKKKRCGPRAWYIWMLDVANALSRKRDTFVIMI